MKYLYLAIFIFSSMSCIKERKDMQKVVFLHHSTGRSVWVGGVNRYLYRITGKGAVEKYFENHNKKNKTKYSISNRIFPKSEPYGWNNYPFDYYNIWVKNGGNQPYKNEPTLEMLTREFDVIIFKHCFPVSHILPDNGKPDINSDEKTLENYKLQYNALKRKMQEFPDNIFIVWTPAALVRNQTSEDEAARTFEFHRWITEEWDEKNDNIFIWDFYKHETEGGLYLHERNAWSSNNSHPGKEFSARVAPVFAKHIIDVIESFPLKQN
jgi:hypothetical protein